jgi:hypothetical protein
LTIICEHDILLIANRRSINIDGGDAAMRERVCFKSKKNVHEGWKTITRKRMEQVADELLRDFNQEDRIYTEQQLERKIRLEQSRYSNQNVITIPNEAAEYLLRKQVELMVQSAKLSKLQGAILVLTLEGLTVHEIATSTKIPHHIVARTLRIARYRISKAHSPYDGLYEVYWNEVHRYVYRKH